MSHVERMRLLKKVLGMRQITDGAKDFERILQIAEAALRYGDSMHTRDSNCCAGDCDSCSAKPALKVLEEIVGGPEGR